LPLLFDILLDLIYKGVVKMNKVLMVLVKVLISVALLGACYWGVGHGSSAAFDLGLGAGFMALFHWTFWGNK
jgi:hypothetical protein